MYKLVNWAVWFILGGLGLFFNPPNLFISRFDFTSGSSICIFRRFFRVGLGGLFSLSGLEKLLNTPTLSSLLAPMARGKLKGRSGSGRKKKKKGPNSPSDEIRTKSMDQILGIEPMELSDEDGELNLAMENNGEINLAIEDFAKDSATKGKEVQEGLINTTPPILYSTVVTRVEKENVVKQAKENTNQICRNVDHKKEVVKITEEDIEEEVIFWKSAMICYVLGANPPAHIFEGFVRRLWKDKIDKVGALKHGIFVVRFHKIEDRDAIMNGGYIFFDKKPVIMKAWNPEHSLQKMEVTSVPIWIQIENLELKYWGEKVLFKIVSQIGEPVRVDHFTKERNRLAYPRVLIEVKLAHKLEENLMFEDEYGQMVSVGVKYEWKPILCNHCKCIGHDTGSCKKKEPTKAVWVVKMKEEVKKAEIDEDGFTKVVNGSKNISGNAQKGKAVVVDKLNSNTFTMLQNSQGDTSEGGGGVPSWGNG